jgi:Uma2 family endonuclease
MSVETLARPIPESGDTGVFLRPWAREEFEQATKLGWFHKQRVELAQGVVYQRVAAPDGEVGRLPRSWTRKEYEQASALNWFLNQRVELIHGKVYQKVSQGPLHAMGIRASSETFARLLGDGFEIRQQLPLVLFEDGMPEPDVLVVPGSWRDYPTHPTQQDVRLLLEISDTTLAYDREEKAALYAEASIADYWIVNIANRTLEVYRDPASMSDTPYSFGYRSRAVHTENETVMPLFAPQISVLVTDLLPLETTV